MVGRVLAVGLGLMSFACSGSDEAGESCSFDRAPNGFDSIAGPGGPRGAFTADDLGRPCAFLDGGEVTFPETDRTIEDPDHHNIAVIDDGFLIMPWAPEYADGGIGVFDVSDACQPERVASVPAYAMREPHAIGFSDSGGAGRFMVLASTPGLHFWNIDDPLAPVRVGEIAFDDSFYPDAYARVVMSLFWQAPYVFVAHSDNGLKVVDATDPAAPTLINDYEFDPPLRAGGVFAVGNLLAVTASEGTRTTLLDISDPADPQPIPGGTFEVHDRDGVPRAQYHAHLNGSMMLYTRKDEGGGLILYDVSDPTAPRFLGDSVSTAGGGGYVFRKDDWAYTGQTGAGEILDIADPTRPTLVTTLELVSDKGVDRPGDFDTLLPLGNVALGVSDDSMDQELDGQATQVFPIQREPDARGPTVTMVHPADGADGVSTQSRVGITLSEFVEQKSVWRGSFRVQRDGCAAPIRGTYSGQEGIVNFSPDAPLRPRTTYEVIVPTGGIVDPNGNSTTTEFRSTFTTGGR